MFYVLFYVIFYVMLYVMLDVFIYGMYNKMIRVNILRDLRGNNYFWDDHINFYCGN